MHIHFSRGPDVKANLTPSNGMLTRPGAVWSDHPEPATLARATTTT